MAAFVSFLVLFLTISTHASAYVIQELASEDYISYETNIISHRNVGKAHTSRQKVDAVQEVMKENNLDAIIVPNNDAHSSSYISPRDARRLWLTDFHASSGIAVVTATEAMVWTDSRYFTQFEAQVDTEVFTLMKQGIDLTIQEWLIENMPPQSVIGIDPTTYTRTAWTRLEENLRPSGLVLEATTVNIVDAAREKLDDPPPLRNFGNLIPMSVSYSGRRADSKVAELLERMTENGADAMVLSALDDIAYTLNIRAIDAIPFNPNFFSYLIIRGDRQGADRVNLFWANGTLPDDITEHLQDENLQLTASPYDQFMSSLQELSDALPENSTIWLSTEASHAIYLAVESNPAIKILSKASPVQLMKCLKNEVECSYLQGFRSAHIKDGIAVVRGLRWVEEQVAAGVEVTEMDLSNKLLELRGEEDQSYGASFATIAGAGENGAMIHYSPPEEGSRVIGKEDMLLVDSGGHYMHGTTDITRTRHMSASPTPEQKNMFTRVLKGQIGLGTMVFRRGTKGAVLEPFARKYLWDVGLDYGHGTGHGIGHFLNVHEGPSGIMSMADDPGIVPGMIFSNEPGYYEVGHYGIRHEDVVEVIALDSQADHILANGLVGNFSGAGAVGFKYISMAPQQAACIEVDLLTDFELEFLNKYHAMVLSTLGPILKERSLEEDYEWLEKECAAIQRGAAILYKSSPFLLLTLFSAWLSS